MCEAQAVEISTNRKRVLVTGASCGIGEAFAHWYAEQGFEVVLAARNFTELTRVAAALQARGAVTEVIVAICLLKMVSKMLVHAAACWTPSY